MKPSNISKLTDAHRREAYRYVLDWWPDRNDFRPFDFDAWWGWTKGRKRFDGART